MILHISNDFNHTKVHKELYCQLDLLGIEQTIFVPLKSEQYVGKNHFDNENVRFIYSKKLKKYHKIFFQNKIKFLYNSLLENIVVQKVELCHATTLFSDGALAFKLFEMYKIPYVVAVRSTDLTVFLKFRKDLLGLGKKILLNASKIIFISEANKEYFLSLNCFESILDKIQTNIEVINNGIDDFWLDHKETYKKSTILNNKIKFLFIGSFIKRKNLEMLFDAITSLNKNSLFNIELHVVGGGGALNNLIVNKISNLEWVNFHGHISNLNKLKEIFSFCDYFTMISHTETFGLVYLEALSQGKPVLYTRNQGIDNLFKFKIGESVNSKDITNIIKQIEELISNDYEEINSIDFEMFRWSKIAEKYNKIYNQIKK